MARCQDCGQEMNAASGCTIDMIMIADQPFARYRMGGSRGARRCHDCGARPRNYHHLGCDMERCPCCSGQLISCGCWDDEWGDEPLLLPLLSHRVVVE